MSLTNTKCLVYLSTPSNVISSISAIKTLNPKFNFDVTWLIHCPGQGNDVLNETVNAINAMIQNLPFVSEIQTITLDSLNRALSLNSRSALRNFFATKFNGIHFDQIFYAHDLGSYLYYSLAIAYPQAKFICYGDAFGTVVERDEYLIDEELNKYKRNSVKMGSLAALMLLYLDKIVRLGTYCYNQFLPSFSNDALPQLCSKNFKPNIAVLILPIGQSRNFLESIHLKVCKKEIFIETVNACANSCVDLNRYINELAFNYSIGKKYVLLMENFSECKFIKFEKEVEMYCEIIKKYCEPGSLIFLKSHPGELASRASLIQSHIGSEYNIIELSTKFKRLPIEIWKRLIESSCVIGMGAPILNIKYLYNINLIQSLNISDIEHWFNREYQDLVKEALSLYVMPLSKLDKWDANSILWSKSTSMGGEAR